MNPKTFIRFCSMFVVAFTVFSLFISFIALMAWLVIHERWVVAAFLVVFAVSVYVAISYTFQSSNK